MEYPRMLKLFILNCLSFEGKTGKLRFDNLLDENAKSEIFVFDTIEKCINNKTMKSFRNLGRKTLRNLSLCFCALTCFISQADAAPGGRVKTIDMGQPRRIAFDSIVGGISCTRLEGGAFTSCRNMIPHKGRFYFMSYSAGGSGLTIYDKNGRLVKDFTLSDAFLVNSMCMVPSRNELWVSSRQKVVSRYDADGNLVKRFSLPFPCTNLYPVGGEDFLLYSGGQSLTSSGIISP